MDVARWLLIDESVRDGITEQIHLAVAAGRHDFERVVRGVAETWMTEVDDKSLLDEAIRDVAAEEFAGHLAAQDGWPAETDNDRLSLAMAELSMAGILAREHYTCCMTCGLAEIRAEISELSGVRGYVFYHEQDAERAVMGGGVYLAFGPGDLEGEGDASPDGGIGDLPDGGIEDSPDGSIEDSPDGSIGEEIVAVLRRRGLRVEWDGDDGQRIHVHVNWRRRRFGPLAEHPEMGGRGEPEAGLRVRFCDPTWVVRDEPVVLSARESRDLLLWLTPRDGNFACYEGESGEVLQFMWRGGVRLWAETPDVAARRSYGRYVTLDEGLAMIAVLAEGDRIGLGDSGDLETVFWS
ncbi:hypothetical protein FXF51_46230 [Nonomuraea sp. PA05]|uniref:DUF6891 domain-containing protein n=1 Tax=Nonomuraea sp. PA05 TaxID=2604466 RepID=UPI0011D97FD2|nr:hypothetical protein [Nonomuraea sp. PA05]TYB55070.1 hypothetical protein FXF51_46230 [Nonomuraea sp. PA05]